VILSSELGQSTRGTLLLPEFLVASESVSFLSENAVQQLASGEDDVSSRYSFASSHDELIAFPDTPSKFPVQDRQNVPFVFRCSNPGKYSILVHLLDHKPSAKSETGVAESRNPHELSTDPRLLASWLVFANVAVPLVEEVNKIQVHVACGSRAKKRFRYENQYKAQRLYHLETSHPEKLRLTTKMILLPPLTSHLIHFVVQASDTPSVEQSYMFITDDHGKVEDCLEFTIISTNSNHSAH